MKQSIIKPKPHLWGNLNHRKTLEHILWIKQIGLSYTQVINVKKSADKLANSIKWE